MAYNNNAGSNTLYPRTFYALYIGPNDNDIGHLIFKLSTQQLLTTMRYQSVPVSENLQKQSMKRIHLPPTFKSINLIVIVLQLKMIISTIPKMTMKFKVMIWIILKMRVTIY